MQKNQAITPCRNRKNYLPKENNTREMTQNPYLPSSTRKFILP